LSCVSVLGKLRGFTKADPNAALQHFKETSGLDVTGLPASMFGFKELSEQENPQKRRHKKRLVIFFKIQPSLHLRYCNNNSNHPLKEFLNAGPYA
jgi:hypothetical protein